MAVLEQCFSLLICNVLRRCPNSGIFRILLPVRVLVAMFNLQNEKLLICSFPLYVQARKGLLKAGAHSAVGTHSRTSVCKMKLNCLKS